MDRRQSCVSPADRTANGPDWSMLMAKARTGDRLAYSTLLEQLLPYLRSICRRYFRTNEEMEESLQDILLTMHAVRHTYDADRPFAPWILAIAKRRIADRLRRRSRVLRREVSLSGQLEAVQSGAPEPHDISLDCAALRRAIGALPLAQRRAVELLRLRELSLNEASAESGATPGALKVALHRALNALRQALAAR